MVDQQGPGLLLPGGATLGAVFLPRCFKPAMQARDGEPQSFHRHEMFVSVHSSLAGSDLRFEALRAI